MSRARYPTEAAHNQDERDRRVSRVLVVDDEEEIRRLLSDVLSSARVEVISAAGAAEAVELARRFSPDMVVADLYLGDDSGLDVIDRIRKEAYEIPAVVISGRADVGKLSEASRIRPVELMTKPLDIDHLRRTVRDELSRQNRQKRQHRRVERLRRLARRSNIERRNMHRQYQTACRELTEAYRGLSDKYDLQQAVIEYQRHILQAGNHDDVFRELFNLFVRHSGAVFGVAMICDAYGQLQIVGRFGVPTPDGIRFCQALVEPVAHSVAENEKCSIIDAGERPDLFDPSIRRYLPGLTILPSALIADGQKLAGMVVLYRKGEQPFTDVDLQLAEMIGPSTGCAVQRVS